jgi:hypothetical protein
MQLSKQVWQKAIGTIPKSPAIPPSQFRLKLHPQVEHSVSPGVISPVIFCPTLKTTELGCELPAVSWGQHTLLPGRNQGSQLVVPVSGQMKKQPVPQERLLKTQQ